MSEIAEIDAVECALCARIDELTEEKETLADENARLLKDNDDLRQEVVAWRGG